MAIYTYNIIGIDLYKLKVNIGRFTVHTYYPKYTDSI